MRKFRFKVPGNDGRPMEFPPTGPFWVTGFGPGYLTVLAYAESKEVLTSESHWPDATDIDDWGEQAIKFSDRFKKPDWWPPQEGEPSAVVTHGPGDGLTWALRHELKRVTAYVYAMHAFDPDQANATAASVGERAEEVTRDRVAAEMGEQAAAAWQDIRDARIRFTQLAAPKQGGSNALEI